MIGHLPKEKKNFYLLNFNKYLNVIRLYLLVLVIIIYCYSILL